MDSSIGHYSGQPSGSTMWNNQLDIAIGMKISIVAGRSLVEPQPRGRWPAGENRRWKQLYTEPQSTSSRRLSPGADVLRLLQAF